MRASDVVNGVTFAGQKTIAEQLDEVVLVARHRLGAHRGLPDVGRLVVAVITGRVRVPLLGSRASAQRDAGS